MNASLAQTGISSLPILFDAVAWLVARQNGTRGGVPAFLRGLLLGPNGLAVVALVFRGGARAL